MNLRKHLKKIIIGACLIIIGTVIIFPVEAHIIDGRDAHTLAGRHGIYFSPRAWVKKYFYTKRQSNTRYYTKTQSNSRYYTKSSVDTLLGSYLTSSNAASTYLTPSAGNSAYVNASGDTMAGDLTATDYNYSVAKTKYLNLSAHGFATMGDMVVSNGGANWVYKASGTGSNMRASISLPNGAVMTNMRLNYFRNDASNAVTAKLYSVAFNGSGGSLLATASSPLGTDWPYSNYVDATPVSYGATINNDINSYYVDINFGATGTTLGAYSVVITYTVSGP